MISIEESSRTDSRFPCIDYVLVHSATSLDLDTPRKLFEDAMTRDELQIEKETIGNNVFLKVTCPFDRLAHEAERIKLEMPIKGCEIKPQEARCCTCLKNMLTTDDEVDFVTAPFEAAKIALYEGSEEKDIFFRPALRSYLVHNIMINLDIKDYLKGHNSEEDDDLVSKRGLLYLLMKKAYTDAFVLHDPSAEEPYYMRIKEKSLEEYYLQIPKTKFDPRREMNSTWVKFWKFQPLWKIRNYFGEKVAFYFAWVGTFLTLLWIPALLGLCIFAYGLTLSLKQLGDEILTIIKEAFDNVLTPFFSLVICLWGTFFLEIWKRNNYTLAYQWDVDSYEHAEPDRPEFFGTKQRPDPVTGELAWIYPISKRFRKFFISGLVSSFMICIVFISVSGVVAFKVLMRVKFNCSGDGDADGGAATSGSPVICLLLTTILPTLLNAVSILILGNIYSRVAEKLTFWENHRTQSEFNDSLIIKLFAFQFANTYTSLFYIAFFRPLEHGFQTHGVFGWGAEYGDTCTGANCMSLLSFQVLVLMVIKPFPKFFKDVVIPWVRRRYRRFRRMTRKKHVVEDIPENRPNTAKSHEEAELTVNNFLEREYLKPNLGDFTLGEYTEKVIQFGYIVMFAASFPLAPFLALIINLFDLRVDAKRLLWWNRRPVAFISSDIGMWYPILRFVNFCGVASNAFLVGYTSSFCQEFFKQHGSTCTAEKRLAIIVVFEHLVFLSMYVINVLVPDIPSGIKLAQRRERYQVIKIMEEGVVSQTRKKKKHKHRDKSPTKKQESQEDGAIVEVAKDPTEKRNNLSSLRLRPSGSADSEKRLLIHAEQLDHGSDDNIQSHKNLLSQEEKGLSDSTRPLTTFTSQTTDLPPVDVPLNESSVV